MSPHDPSAHSTAAVPAAAGGRRVLELPLALVASLLFTSLSAAAPSAKELRERYESAVEFLFWNLEEQVPGLLVEPHWQEGGRRFRYRHGTVTYQVDPARGVHAALAREPGQAPPERSHVALDFARSESPDGRWSMAVQAGNLFVHSSAGGAVRQLTFDGSLDNAYALAPDADLEHLKRSLAGTPETPQGLWSPDGRRFLTYQVGQRDIPALPMVLSTQPGRAHQIPHAHLPRVPLPGAAKVPMARLMIFDAQTAQRVDLYIPPIMMLFGSLPSGGISWSADGRQVHAVHWSRDFREHTLYQADAATGKARAVVSEKSVLPSRQVVDGDDAPIFTRVEGQTDLIVRSVRDGWAHFYLYDARNGELRNQITRGDWAVRRIEWVNARKRQLYFTAGGREAGRDPYYRHLYRVGLDGRNLELLTPENADHEVRVAPSGEYFLDTYSTVSEPPVTVVRFDDWRANVESGAHRQLLHHIARLGPAAA